MNHIDVFARSPVMHNEKLLEFIKCKQNEDKRSKIINSILRIKNYEQYLVVKEISKEIIIGRYVI